MFLLCFYSQRSRWSVVMVDSVQDWRVKLMQAHPRLFGIPFGRPDAARGYITSNPILGGLYRHYVRV
jgi:hypothetical protein